MEPWKPREHDHLVEPMFGGLGLAGEASDSERWRPSRALVFALIVVAAILALRVVSLL